MLWCEHPWGAIAGCPASQTLSTKPPSNSHAIRAVMPELFLPTGTIPGRLIRISSALNRVVLHTPQAAFVPRTRRITCGNMSHNAPTSAGQFSRPNEKRSKALDSDAETPIARMTCEGSIDPAEQADPLDAQIPSISKPAKSAMLSQPITVKAAVFAARCAKSPRKVIPSVCFARLITWSA
jgi:hypothetical protein